MLGGCRIVVCSTCLSAKAAARRGKIQVEMRPFMASVAVIFGVDFTGPHILGVIRACGMRRGCVGIWIQFDMERRNKSFP